MSVGLSACWSVGNDREPAKTENRSRRRLPIIMSLFIIIIILKFRGFAGETGETEIDDGFSRYPVS